MKSSHVQRIATALVLLPVLGAVIFYGGWGLFALVAVASVLAMHEFYAMFWQNGEHKCLPFVAYILAFILLLAAQTGNNTILLAALLGSFWVAGLAFLWAFGKNQTDIFFPPFLVLVAGFLYIPLTLQFTLGLKMWELLLLVIASCASDTAAYYAGTLFGKHKIWPTVSPKKSWEGSVGGFVACTLLCTLWGIWQSTFALPVWGWALLGGTLNIASQFGDFFESALKRSLGVKDSGTILPGHGGILDRIDSLLLVLPCYVAVRAVIALFA